MPYATRQLGKLFDGIAGNASLAIRTTDAQDCTDADEFAWAGALTYGAATAVTITPYKSNNGGTTWVQAQAENLDSAGLGTLKDYSNIKDTSGVSITLEGSIRTVGFTHVKLIASFASGSADDAFTLYGSLNLKKR